MKSFPYKLHSLQLIGHIKNLAIFSSGTLILLIIQCAMFEHVRKVSAIIPSTLVNYCYLSSII